MLIESKRGQVEIFVNVKVNVNENAEGGIRKAEKTLSFSASLAYEARQGVRSRLSGKSRRAREKPFNRGAGNLDGRGSLRGCVSTQATIPGRETAKVGLS